MISNRNGRALEFALVKAFLVVYPNNELLGNTSQDQVRDKELFEQLPDDMKVYYRAHCSSFASWVARTKVLSNGSLVTIHRLTDQEAVAGDVTDIRLVSGAATYNISLKHNHSAVKHQRPGNLFSQLGIDNKAGEKVYKDKIKAISTHFFNKSSAFGTTKFSEVKAKDESIINDFYSDMCALVAETINAQTVNVDHAFRFLVGNCDFDKVIITRDSIQVMQFSGIVSPMSLKAIQSSYNRVQLTFDNGFKFDMRLHTASSKFEVGKAISQKFDTQLIDYQINSFEL